MSAPAGWYPQPDGSHHYWDGSGWTEHVCHPSSDGTDYQSTPWHRRNRLQRRSARADAETQRRRELARRRAATRQRRDERDAAAAVRRAASARASGEREQRRTQRRIGLLVNLELATIVAPLMIGVLAFAAVVILFVALS